MNTIDRIIEEILTWILASIMIGIVLLMFVGVILRYLFDSPIFGSEELVILGLVWIIFLGGAILVKEEKHVAITFIIDSLSKPRKKALTFVNDLLIVLILSIMIYQSWNLSIRYAEGTTPAFNISEAWFGRAMIIGFTIMLYFKIRQLAVTIFSKNKSSQPMNNLGAPNE